MEHEVRFDLTTEKSFVIEHVRSWERADRFLELELSGGKTALVNLAHVIAAEIRPVADELA